MWENLILHNIEIISFRIWTVNKTRPKKVCRCESYARDVIGKSDYLLRLTYSMSTNIHLMLIEPSAIDVEG